MESNVPALSELGTRFGINLSLSGPTTNVVDESKNSVNKYISDETNFCLMESLQNSIEFRLRCNENGIPHSMDDFIAGLEAQRRYQ